MGAKATLASDAMCPNLEDHTHSPTGYIKWHHWADRMSKTHKQRKCAGCGRYAIWEPKPQRAKARP